MARRHRRRGNRRVARRKIHEVGAGASHQHHSGRYRRHHRQFRFRVVRYRAGRMGRLPHRGLCRRVLPDRGFPPVRQEKALKTALFKILFVRM